MMTDLWYFPVLCWIFTPGWSWWPSLPLMIMMSLVCFKTGQMTGYTSHDSPGGSSGPFFILSCQKWKEPYSDDPKSGSSWLVSAWDDKRRELFWTRIAIGSSWSWHGVKVDTINRWQFSLEYRWLINGCCDHMFTQIKLMLLFVRGDDEMSAILRSIPSSCRAECREDRFTPTQCDKCLLQCAFYLSILSRPDGNHN